MLSLDSTLKDPQLLVQGYILNQQRFEQNAKELEQALALIKKAAQSPQLKSDEGRGLVDIISRYTQTFLWLQRYDEGLLEYGILAVFELFTTPSNLITPIKQSTSRSCYCAFTT